MQSFIDDYSRMVRPSIVHDILQYCLYIVSHSAVNSNVVAGGFALTWVLAREEADVMARCVRNVEKAAILVSR